MPKERHKGYAWNRYPEVIIEECKTCLWEKCPKECFNKHAGSKIALKKCFPNCEVI